jgi:hypothetical protein
MMVVVEEETGEVRGQVSQTLQLDRDLQTINQCCTNKQQRLQRVIASLAIGVCIQKRCCLQFPPLFCSLNTIAYKHRAPNV